MTKKRYIVRFYENTKGMIEFPDVCAAEQYAKNVSFNYKPFEATVNEYDENYNFKRIVSHFRVGVKW